MPRMSRMDAAFLAMERPAQPAHIGAVMFFDPGPDGPLTYDAVKETVEARLHLVRSAKRVVAAAPLGLARPSWATDKAFDLEFHVRSAGLGPGGDEADVAAFVGETHARPLDRSRPLWELWVIEGLPGGRVALYHKVHVAALDDNTGAELMTALLDTPEGQPANAALQPVRDSSSDGSESPLELLARIAGPLPDQLRWAAGFPGRLSERAMRSAGEQWPGMRETMVELVQRTPGMSMLASMMPMSRAGDVIDEYPTGRAPRLTFNAPVTAHRVFGFSRLPIEDVLAVKHALGTTFNDVVVAVCAGALRRWLLAHDELPTSPVVAMVPVLVAGAGGGHEDAHVAGLVVPLPTHVADPSQRLVRTHETLRQAKERHAAVPASVLQDMSMFAPPAVAGMAGRLIDALPHRAFVSPTVNLAITNVPGPRETVHFAGRPLVSSHPTLSVTNLTPLHIGLQSGADSVGIGAVACRDTFDDLDALVAAVTVELGELRAAVRPGRKTRARRAAG